MPQPVITQQTAEALARIYADAEARMARQLATLGGPETPKATRLRALQRMVSDEVAFLEQQSRSWLTGQAPLAYHAGAVAAAETVGSDVAQFTQLHREAMQALADQTWTDVLRSTRFIGADTRRTMQQLAKDQTARVLLGEATASRAGRDLAAAVRESTGMLSVRYANGARHGVADWADTLARTASANAYNEGTFTQAKADGIRFMECFDGLDCGLDAHGVPPFANGMVLPTAEARAHPLAHPRCARSWSPRPDATSAERSGLTPDAFDAAAQERARAAQRLVTGERRGKFARERPVRAVRQPRAARTPRQPAAAPPEVVKGQRIGPSVRSITGNTATGRVGTAVEHALDSIEKVHGFGSSELPPTIPIKRAAKAQSRYGSFVHRGKGRAVKIIVNDGEDAHQAFTATHEVGHFIDYSVNPMTSRLGDLPSVIGRYIVNAGEDAAKARGIDVADPAVRAMADVFRAIAESPTAQTLPKIGGKYGRYIRQSDELWARVYSQWVADRSGSEEMRSQIRDILAKRGTTPLHMDTGYSQWPDDEFGPIGEAIDRLMEALGWRT